MGLVIYVSAMFRRSNDMIQNGRLDLPWYRGASRVELSTLQ